MRYLAALLSIVTPAAAQSIERIDRDERCITCHVDQGESVAGSAHARAGVGCISCHGADEVDAAQTRGNPHRRIATFRGYRRQSIPEDCGSCHKAVLEAMRPTGHFAKTIAGNDEPRRMKGCVECHAYHATERAVRSEILTSCARCHVDGTRELADGRTFVSAFDGLELEVTRARDVLLARARSPGRNLRALATAQADGATAVAEARTAQHGLAFGPLETARSRSAESLREAYHKLSAEDRAFGRRWIWLLPFLLLIVLSYVLVRAKARQLQKGA